MSQEVIQCEEVAVLAGGVACPKAGQTTAPTPEPATSRARIEANRANARKSTGPRTPEGKERVARNAVKHGLLCRQAVLESDDHEEFEEFQSALWLDLKPVGAMEEVLAERIVAGHWRLRRAIHLDRCLMDRDILDAIKLEQKHGAIPEGCDPWAEDHVPHPLTVGEVLRAPTGSGGAMERLRRYERTIQRDLAECLRQLTGLQKSRPERSNLEGPSQSPPIGFVSQGHLTEGDRNVACPEAGQATAPASPVPGPQSPVPDSGVGFVSQKAARVPDPRPPVPGPRSPLLPNRCV